MAQKRMFDKRVVESDKFIDLPNSTKALYFMAGMDADDKGFFQPKKLQKLCGFTDDDYKILIAKGFFITFESGVMVITDWNKNNWLDSRRVTPTEYVDELKMLELINEKYSLSSCLAFAKPMLSENRIEENRIEENSIEQQNIKKTFSVEKIIQKYEEEIGFATPTTLTTILSYQEDLPDDMIIRAIEIASEQNKKSLAYIKGILNSWISKNYKTLADVENEKIDKQPKGETEEERLARENKILEEWWEKEQKNANR